MKPTFPIPWSIITAVAPVTLQLSLEELPDGISGGLAVKNSTTIFESSGAGSFGVGAESEGVLVGESEG